MSLAPIDDFSNRKPPYPQIITTDGKKHFVDEDGLVVGRKRSENPGPPPKTIDILAVMEWIEARSITRRKSPSVFSYSLKHAAERWIGRHVSNGAAIIALDRLGFPQIADQQNTWAGIALRSYRLPEVSGWQNLLGVMR